MVAIVVIIVIIVTVVIVVTTVPHSSIPYQPKVSRSGIAAGFEVGSTRSRASQFFSRRFVRVCDRSLKARYSNPRLQTAETVRTCCLGEFQSQRSDFSFPMSSNP